MLEKSGRLTPRERVERQLAQQYPGQDMSSLYRTMPIPQLAKLFGVRTAVISSFIPREEVEARRRSGYEKGLGEINGNRRQIAREQLARAEEALKTGLSEEYVTDSFRVRKSIIRLLRIKHVGSRQGKKGVLSNPTVGEYLQRRDVLDRLLAWEGSELERVIIAERLLQGDPSARKTHKQIGQDSHYSEALVRFREKEILQKIGAFEARDEALRKIRESRERAKERRIQNKKQDEEMTA